MSHICVCSVLPTFSAQESGTEPLEDKPLEAISVMIKCYAIQTENYVWALEFSIIIPHSLWEL